MNSFDEKLARLKDALALAEDQEVAQLLGLSKSALSERKRRDAFPAEKLFEYIQRHPERDIDGHFILTGERSSSHISSDSPYLATNAAASTMRRGPFAPPLDYGFLGIVNAELVAELARRDLRIDPDQYGRLLGGLYDMSIGERRVNTTAMTALICMLAPSEAER